MKIIIFASSSEGNCAYIEEGGKGILIDAGISRRRIAQCLKQYRINPQNIEAVFISHEHYDHIRGLETLCKYEGYPVYASQGTIERLWGKLPKVDFQPMLMRVRFNGMEVRSLPIPHDAEEPLGFVVESDSARLLVATDMGYVTGRVMDEISRCDALILESNHDVEMLRTGPYPPDLQRRILSRWGHLSNAQCAAALKQAAGGKLKFVALAHLSDKNNLPEIALHESSGAIPRNVKLFAADRRLPTGPFVLK